LQSYPLAERHGVAWIWGGRSEDADHALIPALPELEPEQKRTVVFGSLHVRANYELVVDNLMDLTHAGYLHGESVSVGAGVAQPRISSRVKDGVVFSSFLTANVTPPRPFLPFWKDGAPCDYHRICSWQAPSIVKTSIGISEPGKGLETGIWFDGYHLLTPETDLTCHYSWSNARTYALADAAYDEALKALVKRAFVEEDEPMIAACQANMSGETDLYALSPALIETDKPCVLVHHKLMSLIAKEEVAAS
jgi:vanillate O-demethylase monooxygenase subunit